MGSATQSAGVHIGGDVVWLLFIGLLLIWVVLAVVGVLVKAAAWLAMVALILFVVTVIAGAVHAARGH